MSDGINVTQGSGKLVATEDIGGNQYQKIKVIGGEPGSTSVLGVNPDRSINVSVIGALTVGFGNASVITVIKGSVAVVQVGTQITSLVSTVPSSVIVGASIFGQLPGGTATIGAVTAPAGSIATVVNPAGSVTAVSATIIAGSVMSVTNPAGSVTAVRMDSASVLAVQSGTVITSLVSTIPSSVIVGASIFGQLPGGTATLGAVTAPSGSILSITHPAGSVTAVLAQAPAGSIMSVTNPAGSVTAVLSTAPSGSIMSITTPAGSVTAVRTDSASVITTQPAGSLMAVTATAPGGSILSITHPAGSVTGVRTDNASVITTQLGGSVMTVATLAGSVMAVSAIQPAGSLLSITTPAGSVIGVRTDNASVITVTTVVGSVIATLQGASIVGTYAEDSASANTDKGIFTLNVRNDTLASVTSTDGDYSAMTVGPSGEVIVANAPLTKWVSGTASMLGGVPMFNSVTVIAAQGASVFTYITGIQVVNMSATSVLVSFGGATSSIIGYTIAPPGGGSNIPYLNGIKTNANAAFSASISGTASIYVSAQGFISKS